MEMKRCTAAILLVLSLEALVAGRLSAAVADDGVDTIRLPSHGLADETVTAARENGYDSGPSCTKPGNGVGDGDDNVPNGRCRWPYCVNHGNGDGEDVPNGPGVAVQEATAAVAATEGPRLLDSTGGYVSTGKAKAASKKSVADGEEQARPWKCCDLPRCTRSFPPTCSCLDKVKKCAKTCKVCEKADESNGASPRYVCRDSYGGWAGPPCTKSVAAEIRRGN